MSFFRNTFCLDMKCKLVSAITLFWNVHLNVHEQAIVDILIARLLFLTRNAMRAAYVPIFLDYFAKIIVINISF